MSKSSYDGHCGFQQQNPDIVVDSCCKMNIIIMTVFPLYVTFKCHF